jgi:FlaA1/EpsC-like NDP-sugar epimerase
LEFNQYTNLITDSQLTVLDPLYTTIAVFSALLLLASLKFEVPTKIMLFVGAFTILLSAQLFFITGILEDELNANGATKHMVFLISIIILQIVTIVLAFVREKKKAK